MKRRWVLWLLTVGLVWLIVAHRSEVRGLAQVLRQGIWYWLLAAVLLQVVYHLVLSELYRSSFDTLDVPSRTFDLLPIVVSSVFVNLVAPTGGASGAALFVDDASRRGQPAARVAAGALLEYVADLAAFLFLLAAGMGELLLHHDLTPIDAVASLILFLLTVTLATVLLLGLWRPAWLRRRLVDLEGWLRSSGRRFGRPDLVRAGWGETTADEFGGAGEAVRRHPLRLLRTLGIAFGAHLVDLATLGAVCLAFRQPVSPGVLLAAYAVGVLFWIVALTPQGVGIVEGAMTLVLARLGVPFHSATAIALVFRGAAFWLPLLAGFLVVRRIGSFRQPRRQEAGAWEVQAVAVMAAVMGLVNLLSAATPSLASRLAILRQVLPLEVRQGGHLAAALAGFGLILLAYNLSRRKRLGWVLAISLLVISAVSHLIKGLDYEEAGLALLLVLCLILLRHHFHARSDPPSARQALQVLAAALAFTLAYGTAGFYLL
ncbi:MAG TPA: flippase-like domain-containing protein, partial [Anaerolineales bacterium]|nr:flippase-like domain-containing protein [Anaerolineales bacterium]